MKALGRHDVGFNQAKQRIKRRADRSHRVGHGRKRDWNAFQSITLGLTVQRLMLAELLKHDHGQQAWTSPASCNGMERCRRLADLLAVAARELLPHRLDHLPLARHRFQRPGHVFAEFAQAIAAAAFTRHWRIDHHALAGKMIRERIAFGARARKSAHARRLGNSPLRRKFVFSRGGFQLFECQRQLVDQARRAFRPLPVDLALKLGDPQLLLGNQRAVFRCFRPSNRKLRCDVKSLGAFGRQRFFQSGYVVWKSVASRVHANERIINSLICGALKCTWSKILFGSAGALRSPCQLRISPVDPFQHISHLGR
jgi:hypothetical protein